MAISAGESPGHQPCGPKRPSSSRWMREMDAPSVKRLPEVRPSVLPGGPGPLPEKVG